MAIYAVFLFAFVLSSLAGVASLLRSPSPLSTRTVASAALNSGLLGLAVSLVWYLKYQDNLYFLIGLCLIAGLGGTPTVEFAAQLLRQGSVLLRFGSKL